MYALPGISRTLHHDPTKPQNTKSQAKRRIKTLVQEHAWSSEEHARIRRLKDEEQNKITLL
jgi:hypothetical protein